MFYHAYDLTYIWIRKWGESSKGNNLFLYRSVKKRLFEEPTEILFFYQYRNNPNSLQRFHMKKFPKLEIVMIFPDNEISCVLVNERITARPQFYNCIYNLQLFGLDVK